MTDDVTRWRKSSHSGAVSECVELVRTADVEAIRDSKNPRGPVLRVNLGALLAAVQRGQFDHPGA